MDAVSVIKIDDAQRPQTSMSNASRISTASKRGLPVIQHPSSRLGNAEDLNIRGVSRLDLHDGNGEIRFTSARKATPLLNLRQSCPSRIMGWPPEYEVYKDEVFRKRTKKYDTHENQKSSKMTAAMLQDLIREKLTAGYHIVRQQFRANDPYRKGGITREALQRILSSLCGFVTLDQLNTLLHRLGMSCSLISFDDFMSHFKDNETVSKEWLNTSKQKDLKNQARFQQLEDDLRSDELKNYIGPFMSAGWVSESLKDKAKNGKIDVQTLFPESCLHPNGYIVGPQLREACAKLDMHMRDYEFEKLWERYDLENLGAMKSRVLFRRIGLDPNGRPKTTQTNLRKFLSSRNLLSSIASETLKILGPEEKDKDKCSESPNSNEAEEISKDNDRNEKVVSASKTAENVETYSSYDVLDQLYIQFEKPYKSIMKTFEHFDLQNDGFCPRLDFRKVLKEYSLPVSAIDLERVLARLGQRIISGQVNYKAFISRYIKRSDNSIMARVMNTRTSTLESNSKSLDEDCLSPEELEEKLIEFFHHDFFKLYALIQRCDNYNLGVISQNELKSCIEKVLKTEIKFKENQWKNFFNQIKVEKDGKIFYQNFLEKFRNAPGKWNSYHINNISFKRVNDDSGNPVELEKIKNEEADEMAKKGKLQKEKDDMKNEGKIEESPEIQEPVVKVTIVDIEKKPVDRPVSEILSIIRYAFKNRFHSIDKAYKSIERKMTGRMNKEQFGKVMDMCEINFTSSELDSVWNYLKLSRDGVYSYGQLIQHFILDSKNVGPPPITDGLPTEDTTEIIKEMKDRLRNRREIKKIGDVCYRHQLRSSASERSDHTEEIIQKIRPQIIQNWVLLKSNIRALDPDGYSYVLSYEMKDLLKKVAGRISSTDLNQILFRFDKYHNGRFYYLPFLDQFIVRDKEDKTLLAYNRTSHKLEQKQRSGSITVDETIRRMRIKVLKEWKSLRRTFRKFDSHNTGFLSTTDFKRCLDACGIQVSSEDLYHLLSEFDNNLNGKISYDNFLAELLGL